MKIETFKTWFDKKEVKIRQIGDIQEVSEERYKEIVSTLKKYGEYTWVKPVKKLPNYEEITVKEIKNLLDTKGVTYDDSLKKKELYELLK